MLSHLRVALFERIRRIGRCDLVGEKKTCHWGWTLRPQKPMPSLEFLSLSLAMGQLLLQQLPACCHPSHHDENGLNLSNCKQAPREMFPFVRLALVMVSHHSNTTVRQPWYFVTRMRKVIQKNFIKKWSCCCEYVVLR